VANNLTVTSGTLTTGALNLTVTGATSIGGAITAGAGTLSFGGSVTGAGALTASTGSTSVGGNLTVGTYNANGSGATLTLNGSTTPVTLGAGAGYALNNLTLGKAAAADVINLGAPVQVAGKVTIGLNGATLAGGANTLQLAGNWDNSAGGTVMVSGTVDLTTTATAQILGSNTFGNLTSTAAGKTIQFQAGGIQTISGNFTITGTTGAATLIHLASTSSPTQWNINPIGAASVTFATVEDSNDSSLTVNITATDTGDLSNNDTTLPGGWSFQASSLVWVGGSGTAWTTGANWDLGFPPKSIDDVTIGSGAASWPVLTGSITVNALTMQAATSFHAAAQAVTVTSNLSSNATGTYDFGSGGTLTVAGNVSFGTVANPAGSTFILNSGGSQTVAANGQNLDTVSITNSSTARWSGTSTVGTVGVVPGSTLNLDSTVAPGAVTLNVTGGTTLTNNGTLTLNSGGGTVTLRGSGPTFTYAGNDISYNGQTLHLGNMTSTLATNLSAASSTVIQDANVTFAGGVTLSGASSQWQVGANTLLSGAITASAGSLNVGAGATVNAGASTVTVSGGDITFAGTPASFACGDLTVSSGTITNTAANAITATGNVTVSIANANFSAPANSTIVMGASSGKTIDATTTIGNLTVNPGAGFTNTISTSQLTLAGALAVQSGTFGLNSQNLTVATDVTGTGRVTAAGSEAVSVGGNWSLSLLTAASSTVIFTGSAGAGPFTITSNAQSFNNLAVNGSGKTYQTSGALLVAGTLDITAGTLLKQAADNITVTGAINGAGGTVDFGGGGTVTVGGNATFGTVTSGPGSILVLDGGAAQTVVPNAQVLGTLHTTVASTAVTLAGTVTLDGIAVDASTSLTLGATGAAAVTVAGATADSALTAIPADVLVTPANGLNLDGTNGSVTLTMGSAGQPNTVIHNAIAGGIRVVSSANMVTIGTSGGTTTLSGNELHYSGQTLHLGNLTSVLATSLATANDTVIQDADVTFSGGISLSGTTSLWQVGANTLTSGSINATAGSIDASGGGNISASGNVAFGGGTFTKGTGLFSFVASGAQTLTSGGQDLGNIDTSDATVLTVADAGNFDSVTIGATSAAAGSINLLADITVGGNWTNNIGFTGLASNGHAVTFDKASGSVNVLGNSQFFSINCTVPGLFINFGPTTIGGSNDTTVILTGGVFHVVGVDNPVDGTYDSNWITLNVTNGPADGYWHLQMDGVATFNMSFVQVNWSYADIAVTTPDNVQTVNCFQWFSSDPVMASYAEDSDGDGKIDRIRVICVAAVNDNFSDFAVSVSGYTVRAASPFTTGTPADSVFYLNLNERPELDTGATIAWQITHNTLLRDQVNNAQLVIIPGGTAVAADDASPVIAYTLAVTGKAQIFLRFSEPVYANAGTNTALTSVDFTISGGNNQTVTSVVPVSSSGNGYTEILLNLSAAIAASDIATPETITMSAGQDNPTVAPSPVVNPPGSPGVPAAHSLYSSAHRITDVGLGPPGAGMIEPVYAWDQTIRDPTLGGIGLISKFDGSEFLAPQNITIQANVNGALGGHGLSLWIDSKPSARFVSNGLWLPPFNESNYSGLVPYPDTGADNSASGPVSPGGQLENWVIPSSNSNIYNHANLQFFFQDSTVSPPLYYGRMTDANSPTWYLNVRPWTIEILHVISQRANVTILNNVINPDKGQKASLYYTLPSANLVTITVFDLSGNVVAILYRGQLAAGDHSTTWNGTNQQGRAVARGIYFMRVVASGIDEYRKVLVVR